MKNPLRRETSSTAESAAAAASTAKLENALRQAWLDRVESKKQEEGVLAKFRVWLDQHLAELELAKLRCCRMSADINNILGRMCYMDGDPNALARKLIAGEDLMKIVSDARKDLGAIYQRIDADKEEIDALKAVDGELAAVAVLKQAIKLQTTLAAEARRRSIAELSSVIAETRSSLARAALAAVFALQSVADQDRHLTLGLEEDEVTFMSPTPFPERVLSDRAISWLLAAADTGLVRREELPRFQLPD